MSEGLKFITLNNSIVFNIDKQSITVTKGTAEYTAVCAALADGRFDDIPGIINKEKSIVKSLQFEGVTEFTIVDGTVLYNDAPVDSYIARKLIEFYDSGLPYKPLLNFWKRLCMNPSKNSIAQLYRFLEAARCPITEEGMIVSVKGVIKHPTKPNTYVSKHDKEFEYVIGVPAKIDRRFVADTPSTACGAGVHAGSVSYAKDWAGHEGLVLELLIDPVNVVSVPNDCSSQKMRCCEVLPVAIYKGGEFTKGLAIEAQPEVENASDEPTNTGFIAGAAYVINKEGYTPADFPVAAYANVLAASETMAIKVAGLMRYRASKAPAAVRRYFTAASLVLGEAYVFSLPTLSGVLMYMARTADERKAVVFVHETLEADKVVTYCVNKKVVKEKKVVDLFTAKYKAIMLMTYAREQFELIDITGVKNCNTIDEFLEKNTEGVVLSSVRIKPSKAPVSLSAYVSDAGEAIVKLLRVELASTAVAFLVQTGTHMYLMRKDV